MLAALLLSTTLAIPLGLQSPSGPNLPVFGGGKFVNVFDGDGATTNASAHVAWSLAVPLAGQLVAGRKGLWTAGLSWIALSLTTETFFHAPAHPGPGYPAEVRADLLTRIVPCAALLAWDLLRSGRPPERAIEPARPRFLLILPGIDFVPGPAPPSAARVEVVTAPAPPPP